MAARGVAAVVLFALLSSCAQDLPEASPTPTASSTELHDELTTLCEPAAFQFEAMVSAQGKKQRARWIRELAGSEKQLVEDLREVEVPEEMQGPLDRYIKLLEDTSILADHLQRTESVRFFVERSVDLSKKSLRLRKLSKAAGLPHECPPPVTVNVYNTVFVARANKRCFEIGRRLTSQIGREFKPTTVAEVTSGLTAISNAIKNLIQGLERDISEEIRLPALRRVIDLYEKEKRLIDQALDAFNAFDQATLDRVLKEAGKSERKIIRTTALVGMFECTLLFGSKDKKD